MTGASFILAINLFIAALFALAFLLVATTNRADRVAGWFSLAYVFGLAYVGSEFILPVQGDPRFAYTAGFAAFFGAMASVAIGIARRYRSPVPYVLIGVTAVAGIAANWLAFDLPRDSLLRMLTYQAPYAMMQTLAAIVVLRTRRRQPMDLGLIALFGLSAVQFMSKPLIAVLSGGSGSSAGDYIFTTYALFSQSLGAVLQVATGLLMLMLLVRDMLVEVTARSETDPLSGLLNRRGFEDRALAALAQSGTGGGTVSLVTCDLDSFKAINDSFGHDTGDQVIMAFARLLADSPPQRAIISRIGGEEFAVLLPGTPLAAARLYAETIRAAFAALPIAALPQHMRCTASFGIAEHDGSGSLSDLRRRADAALYVSKRAGRDRVSVATDPELDAMPRHPLKGTAGRST
ncbi:MAG: GGDEF domain-containing protein [Devosia sp.]|nr:GGDEF domain-containing protein [Devosia sp.]